MRHFYILLLGASLLACKGTKETSTAKADTTKNSSTTTTVKSYETLATERLGDKDGKIQYEMNASKNYALCKVVSISKNIPMTPAGGTPVNTVGSGNVKFIVVNIAQGDVVLEKSIAYGSVAWHSDTQLKIVEIMGANMPNNPNTYLYNVVTGKKTSIENIKGEDKLEKY